jgi:formylglycine-generating enzyme required for sulfatase activity
MLMRLPLVTSTLAVIAVGCGVDYRVDDAEYNKRLCAALDSSCVPGTGGIDGGVDAGSGGFGGDGGAFGTGGLFAGGAGGTGGLFAGGAGGFGGISAGGAGGTGGTSACLVGDQRCNGTAVETCPAGTWVSNPCQAPTPACESGLCVPCVEGTGRCSGATPQTCSAHAWVSQTACAAGTICETGRCVAPPSCTGLASTCGATGNQYCCGSLLVPGDTYYHNNKGTEPATISDVLLDRYEVTVGRFRKFVAAYATYRPLAGTGANPKVKGSGWDAAWTPNLPVTPALLTAALNCNSYTTWTDAPGALENRPINCLDWYTAFMFCAWDGGFLPTDTQWNYAASGGADQRIYPWGNTAPAYDATLAIYNCLYNGTGGSCSNSSIAPVGSAPGGNAKWGHVDMAGNVEEWVLDSTSSGTFPSPCVDCALLSPGSGIKGLRGGAFNSQASSLQTSVANAGSPSYPGSTYGVRCARTP